MTHLNDTITNLRRLTDGMVADVDKSVGIGRGAVVELARLVGELEQRAPGDETPATEAADAEPKAEAAPDLPVGEAKPLSRMTKDELVAEARARGLGDVEGMTVRELRELLRDE